MQTIAPWLYSMAINALKKANKRHSLIIMIMQLFSRPFPKENISISTKIYLVVCSTFDTNLKALHVLSKIEG